jgi:acyl-CoA synthetase (NDP forming)
MKPKEIFRKIKKQGRNVLTVFESQQILECYKIPIVKSKLAKTVNDTVKIADKIGYPVVLKVVSPQIIHKTDFNGIILDIKNSLELKSAYEKIIHNVKRKVSKAKIQGMLVQKMIEDGQQVIVGGKKDLQFGQVIMFGMGGIFTEIFEDVSFRVVPINRKDAKEMIEEIKGYKILKGYRGKNYDIKALTNILLKTSKLLLENQEIEELDINPIIVLKKGAIAVDARIAIK